MLLLFVVHGHVTMLSMWCNGNCAHACPIPETGSLEAAQIAHAGPCKDGEGSRWRFRNKPLHEALRIAERKNHIG